MKITYLEEKELLLFEKALIFIETENVKHVSIIILLALVKFTKDTDNRIKIFNTALLSKVYLLELDILA